MSTNAISAAKKLLSEMEAPAGAVNAWVDRDPSGDFIRIWIDPLQGFLAARVPNTYAGFRVIVETREPALGV
ncbi:hypothetical protein [Bradyrhizobium sp. USDA 10063]